MKRYKSKFEEGRVKDEKSYQQYLKDALSDYDDDYENINLNELADALSFDRDLLSYIIKRDNVNKKIAIDILGDDLADIAYGY